MGYTGSNRSMSSSDSDGDAHSAAGVPALEVRAEDGCWRCVDSDDGFVASTNFAFASSTVTGATATTFDTSGHFKKRSRRSNAPVGARVNDSPVIR